MSQLVIQLALSRFRRHSDNGLSGSRLFRLGQSRKERHQLLQAEETS
jgi:hypothetical protein